MSRSEFHESISTIYRFKGQVNKKLRPVRSKTRWLFPSESMKRLARATLYRIKIHLMTKRRPAAEETVVAQA